MLSLNSDAGLWVRMEKPGPGAGPEGRPRGLLATRFAAAYPVGSTHLVLINGLSGAVDLLHAGEAVLAGGRLEFTPAAPWPRLRERAYVVSGAGEERLLQDRVFTHHQTTGRTRTLEFRICPTYQCNLRCTYCYQQDLPRRRLQLMSAPVIDAAFSAVDALCRAIPHRAVELHLFGGEPLWREAKPALGRILEAVSARGQRIGAITSGANVWSLREFLAPYRAALGPVRVTVDGPQPVHDRRRTYADGTGTFEDIGRGIDLLLDWDVPVVLRVNLDADNIDHLAELCTVAAHRGWARHPGFSVCLASLTDRRCLGNLPALLPESRIAEALLARWDLAELYAGFRLHPLKTLHQAVRAFLDQAAPPLLYHCDAATQSTFTLGPDGFVHACNETLEFDRWALGTFHPALALREGALEAWSARSVLSLARCRRCRAAFFCGGGCAFSSLYTRGDLGHVVCAGAEATLEACVRGVEPAIRRALAARPDAAEGELRPWR